MVVEGEGWREGMDEGTCGMKIEGGTTACGHHWSVLRGRCELFRCFFKRCESKGNGR